MGCCWPSANTQPMKFGGAPSTNIMDRCTRRQCQHSPAAPTGAGGDPSHHPHQGGRLGALTVRGSAARSFCSSGSQAQLATAYGCVCQISPPEVSAFREQILALRLRGLALLAPNRFRSAFFTSRVRLSLLPLFSALLPHTPPAAAGNAHQCPEGNGACGFELCDACL